MFYYASRATDTLKMMSQGRQPSKSMMKWDFKYLQQEHKRRKGDTHKQNIQENQSQIRAIKHLDSYHLDSEHWWIHTEHHSTKRQAKKDLHDTVDMQTREKLTEEQ
jgi:hypothetical protein